MRDFSALYEALDRTTSTNAKVALVRDYLSRADPADGAWAVYFLAGRRLRRLIGPARLRRWLAEAGGLPDWLVEESYQHVGDLAETVALLAAPVDGEPGEPLALHRWVEERLLPLAGAPEAVQRERVLGWWRREPPAHVYLLTKLLTGSLRVGVSRPLLERALAAAAGLPRTVIAARLTGDWTPGSDFFRGLFAPGTQREDDTRPYPFFLASPLAGDPAGLGPVSDWLAEWKWDGIRAQLVRRASGVYLWSRGEELVTGRFPEIAEAAAGLPPDTVLDGEVLAWRDGVLGFAELQRRIGRKTVGRRLRQDVPAVFLAYDLLEQHGRDLREQSQSERRRRLETLPGIGDGSLRLSPLLEAEDWETLARRREESRTRGVEGLMLKRRDAAYASGRRRGAWWKWKIAPLTVDAVLLYAQPGHGRRASLYTDYTFGVWNDDALVPVAKAYSGLDDGEIDRLDRWIRRHTLERFGPVRSVPPVQVFELAFEGIAASSRHHSGVALRFPRIARWRTDLAPSDADTLEQVRGLLEPRDPARA